MLVITMYTAIKLIGINVMSRKIREHDASDAKFLILEDQHDLKIILLDQQPQFPFLQTQHSTSTKIFKAGAMVDA